MSPSTASPVYELVVPQGATLRRTFRLRDNAGELIDLTGYSARLQVRERIGDPYTVLDVDSEAPSPAPDGTLTMGGTEGTIALEVPAEVTAALDYDGGVYDLELVSADGVVTRLLQGPAPLDREVTR